MRQRSTRVPLARRLWAVTAAALGASLLAAPASASHGTFHVDDLTASGVDPVALAEALSGDDVSVDPGSVEYTGANSAAGAFRGGSKVLDFNEGIVLSSGMASAVEGPNASGATTTSHGTEGDEDLDALAAETFDGSATTNDAAVLEFDFDVAGASEVSFSYVFGSEEYNEYVGSGFNDVFAFWVNGENCATVPDPEGGDRLPVTINSVNQGRPITGVEPVNEQLYVNNTLYEGQLPDEQLDTEMDGMTVTLDCTAEVQAGSSNTLRLAIADTGDTSLDAWVLLQGGSLQAVPEPEPEPEPETGARVQDLILVERMHTIDEGAEVDIHDDLIDFIETQGQTPVAITDDVDFVPTDALDPQVTDAAGEVRDDVALQPGVLTDGASKAFALLATPDEGAFIRTDDELQFFFDDIDPNLVDVGDPIVVDHGFVQTLPGDDPVDPAADGPELLAERAQTGALNVFSVEDDSGQTQWGALRQQVWRTFEGSTGAGIPPKAQPLIDGIGEGAWDARGGGVGGVKDLLDSIEEGFEESMNNIFPDDSDLGDNQRCASPPCSPPNPPPNPPSPPCIGDCGRLTGEPHLETFDGHHYDMQGEGEFVAARTDGFEVQVRTTGWLGDRVSVSTAVAVQVGDERVTFNARDDRWGDDWEPVLIDGQPVSQADRDAGSVALDEGQLSFHGSTAQLRTDDGHQVTVKGLGGKVLYGLYISEGDPLLWEGLLGDSDGDPSNDMVTRDGDDVGTDPTFDELYDEFAESWRISDAESLFDYPTGMGTEDFTDRSIPAAPVTVDDLSAAEYDAAEAACLAAGIEDEQILEECILDYALTGDPAFLAANQGTDATVRVASGELDPASGIVPRVAGTNRIATAVKVSQELDEADTVVIATAQEYADALAGAPLATQLDAPILLTEPDGLSSQVAMEIERLGASEAVLLGGESAIGLEVGDDLGDLGLSVERIAGPTRFDTAADIADEVADAADGDLRPYVVEGIHSDDQRGWPDAVAVSSLAAFEGSPILLVEHGAVPDATEQVAQRFDDFVVVGGDSAVSNDVKQWFEDRDADGVVERRFGPTRYGTSASVADLAVGAGVDPSTVYLTTGQNWPDSVSAAPVVGLLGDGGSVMLMVHGDSLSTSQAAEAWLTNNADDVDEVVALGGPGAIADGVVTAAEAIVE